MGCGGRVWRGGRGRGGGTVFAGFAGLEVAVVGGVSGVGG